MEKGTAPISLEARRAAIAGTRALIADERWSALLALLIEAKVVSPAEVAAMCERLAARLESHARGEIMSEYVQHPGELFDAAARAMALGMMCEARCG